MKTCKRLIAMLLLFCMLLGLCACSSTKETEPAKEQAAAENTAAAAETAEEVSADGTQDFSGRELVLGAWSGTFADACMKAYVEPFEKLTGAKITIEEYGDDVVAKVIAQKEQGIDGYDIVTGCGVQDQIAVMASRDALTPLDYSKLPNAEGVSDNAKFEYAIGQYIISSNLAWNKDVYGDNPPDTMEKYFDVENYPGNRGMISYSGTGQLESALIADGVAVEDLYPLDTERAFSVLDRIKPYVNCWWSSGGEIRQALASGEVDCGLFWGGSVIEGIETDNMSNIEISQQDAYMIVDCFGITATCEDLELAHAFINYCVSGEASARWAELKFYSPVTPAAFDYLDANLTKYFSSNEEYADQTWWINVDFWIDNFETLNEEYLLWISR